MIDTPIDASDTGALHKHGHASGANIALTIGALGVVFGDIGTSPLYAFKVALDASAAVPAQMRCSASSR